MLVQVATHPSDPDTIETKTGQTPRKVVAGYFLSLDGVAEAPDRFITAWDDETDASGANLIATQDAVILGRRSYDEWAEFWPGSEIHPFSSFMNAVPKYVATSTPLEPEWTNSRVIDGRLVDFAAPEGSAGRRYRVHAAFPVTGRCLLPTSSTSLCSSRRRSSNRATRFDGLPPIRLETIRSTASPSGHSSSTTALPGPFEHRGTHPPEHAHRQIRESGVARQPVASTARSTLATNVGGWRASVDRTTADLGVGGSEFKSRQPD
jgi:hypothetical protein